MSELVFEEDKFAAMLGIVQEPCSKDGCGAVRMPLKECHHNKMGNAHGGAIFTLTDMAFAAACKNLGIHCVSAQCSISYLSAGTGDYLRAEAESVKLGRHLAVFDITVTDSNGRRVAKATMTGYVVGPLALNPAPEQAVKHD
ncbi:MAG: PaaI family thioesterase [Mailhella sp.]|nr:PaaI family thioesterase [Mailhella sp.]